MKKNKVIINILFILLVLPFVVNAKTCNKNDIKIETIELNEIKGNAEETSVSSNDNNQINLNAKMNVVGDSLTYKVVIKNTSNSDYIFDQNQITKDYINYDISYDDESNIIKAGEEKTIYLRLNYQEKPQVENLTNGVFTKNNQVSFQLINESGSMMDNIINPETRNKAIIVLIVIITILGIVIILGKKSKKITTIMIGISLVTIPQIVKAMCTCTLDVNLNLEIDAKEATFLPGKEVNIKMKHLAGDDTSTVTNKYTFENQTITAIRYSENEPTISNKEGKNNVSTEDSSYPIYMWYEDGTIYWWSEDKTPSLNEDASYMYANFFKLRDIDGLDSFDLTSTTTLSYLFNQCRLLNVNPLTKWNTSNITNLDGMLAYNMYIADISGIENWDVSKVTTMRGLFNLCYGLEEIDLSNWKTKSLTDMGYMFAMAYNTTTPISLKRITLSEKFDTSKVTSLAFTFYHIPTLEDSSFLKYLDTSNVTNLQHAFYNTHLTSLEDLKDWDVSSVTNMSSTFCLVDSIHSLDGLENWDVSKVTTMLNMFYGNSELEDASAINNWDISSVTTFTNMFKNTPVHPEFTKIQGTWSNGTFTPN